MAIVFGLKTIYEARDTYTTEMADAKHDAYVDAELYASRSSAGMQTAVTKAKALATIQGSNMVNIPKSSVSRLAILDGIKRVRTADTTISRISLYLEPDMLGYDKDNITSDNPTGRFAYNCSDAGITLDKNFL